MTESRFMAIAIQLGKRMLGRTGPNPAVGCVLVKDGDIIGCGWTADGGRPHAETQALLQAGDAAHGATAYVSLEPCAHYGKTGPCAEALVKAGVACVVIAVQDPDPRVAGSGASILRTNGVQVHVGVMQAEAEEVHAGFFMRIHHGRPLFTLKMASTLDGRIVTGNPDKPGISGDVSRDYAHRLRITHDAIMVGSGTVEADDPMLNCRLPGCDAYSPIRIVVDTDLSISPESQLIKTADQYPLWIVTAEKTRPTFLPASVKLIEVPLNADGLIDLSVMAKKLGAEGITRVLVEGGAGLAKALLKLSLIDRVEWVTAPFTVSDVVAEDLKSHVMQVISKKAGFIAKNPRALGHDRLESFARLS